ncbi:MAG: hypothetical protein ABR888_08210 [Thermoplasmata archaeon]|jgi:hypothetical protein
MSSESEGSSGDVGRPSGRRMSMTMAIVVMVVVIIIVGGVGYVALSATSNSGTQTISACSPPNSPVCLSSSGLTDVVLTVPYGAGFGQAVATTTQGSSIPATVSVSGGEGVSQYQINWGDGSNSTGGSPTANHAYTTQGWYVVSAQALVGTYWHTGPKYLFPLDVKPNYQTTTSGYYPTLSTTFTNGSHATTQFGWLSAPGTVSVSATYTENSTATGYTDAPPILAITPAAGTTESNGASTATNVSSTYSFSTAGLYFITMVGKVNGPQGAVLYENYTWTVYVAPAGVSPGCASCSSSTGSSATSPHPGDITNLEVAPAGAVTEDPSVAYDFVSSEALYNVYETLVVYNGSNTASFLPQLSLCVPGDTGSSSCQAIYGNPLIVDNATTGEPQYWTFPIDPAARFYDPATKAGWPVYPSDLMFSLSRTCGFADLPGVASQPGWIQCQALLPNGNPNFDNAIHSPYNNTPGNVLSSMLVNNTTYCPSSILAHSNGCITFNAWGGGHSWPFALELFGYPMGAAVVPCGWFTYEDAGVPGFGTSAANGDGPCYLPGSTPSHPITSTSDPAWTSYVSSLSPTYWDAFEELALNTPGIQPNVRWNMVGSGPYYLANEPFQQSVGYTLKQNPDYLAPTGCPWAPYCSPLPGPTHYASTVTVVYEATDTVGIEQYKAGQTDFATILAGETPQMLSLVQEGKIGAFTTPTLTVNTLGFTLQFDVAAAKVLDPNILNIPGDFFSHIGLREFLANAFPYNTVENTIFTTDGIQYGINFGGVIPHGMGNYYPTNISWPSGDPVTNAGVAGSAAWWWAQATNSSSPYFDPELASCTTSSPCQFPIIGQRGYTTLDQLLQDYMPFISSLSGGRLAPNTYDLTNTQDWTYSTSSLPGQSPMPFYLANWAPDYPDPTDYALPFYYPNATYTLSGSLEESLSLQTCSGGSAPNGMPSDSGSIAAVLFWANLPEIPQACQGNAYSAMTYGLQFAASMPTGPDRVLMYNLAEHIANSLALYVYFDQGNDVVTYAAWINPTTINTNPMSGAIGANTYFLYTGNGVLSS